MKKLIALSILLVLLSAAAFAQLKVGFTSDNIVDLVYYTVGQEDSGNGDKMEPKGSFDFLRTHYTDSNELRLSFTYTGENYEAKLELSGDELVKRGAGFYDKDASKKGFNFFELLRMSFGDYYVKGSAGIFSGYVGKTADRGKTVDFRYANYNDFLKFKVEQFGIIKADMSQVQFKGDATKAFSTTDNNNLAGGPWLGFNLNLSPISIDLATTLSEGGFNEPRKNADAIDAEVRVSGVNIADLITFDVIYKLKGMDPNNQLRGSGGKWTNTFGVYAGVKPNDDFGIGVGLSGEVDAYEAGVNSKDTKSAKTIVAPFWAGIDLRISFTGIDKIGITFNNNVSFAAADGSAIDTTDFTKDVYSLDGKTSVGKDNKELWAAWFAGLVFDYKLSDAVALKAQIANTLGGYTLTPSSGSESKTIVDSFDAAVSAEYTLNPNVTFEAGLAVWNNGVTHTPGSGSEQKSSTFCLGVPLKFKVSF
jgi:hypothetical protein